MSVLVTTTVGLPEKEVLNAVSRQEEQLLPRGGFLTPEAITDGLSETPPSKRVLFQTGHRTPCILHFVSSTLHAPSGVGVQPTEIMI